MKKISQMILMVAASMIVALILCELGIRVLWNAQAIKMDNLGVISYEFMRERSDPDLPFELKPNLELFTDSGHIVTNSDGFRDKEYPVKKDTDVIRILVLGDSITFGYAIKENRDIYYNILEEKLDNYAKDSGLDKRFEVIGIAAPGYNTYTELSILKKKGLKYRPDLVFFAYCLNDMRDAGYAYEYAYGLRMGCANPSLIKLPSAVRRFLRRSVLYSYLAHSANLFVSNLAAKRELKKAEENRNPAPAKSNPVKVKAPSPEKTLYFSEGSEWYNIYIQAHRGKYLEIFDRYILDDLEALSEKYDFKVIFAIFPAFEKDPSYYPEGESYVFEDIHKTLKGVFEKHGFYMLDLKENLGGRKFNDVAIDDCHLSLEGHSVVSEVLFNYVKENFINKSG